MNVRSLFRQFVTQLRLGSRSTPPIRRRPVGITAFTQSETLEDRQLLAATVSLNAGVLSIRADSNGSTVNITDTNPADYSMSGNGFLIVNTQSQDVSFGFAVPKIVVRQIEFVGSPANDVYNAPTGWGKFGPIQQSVHGHGGHDRLTTGMGNDYLSGHDGDDRLRGGGGNDRIYGGSGRDQLHGDAGNDYIVGSWGPDTIWGGSGDDEIHGGPGFNWIYGNDDDDWIYHGRDGGISLGGEGNDHLIGGSGNDFLYGGDGLDGLFGGDGYDSLNGGPDPDRFLIETDSPGNDVIYDRDSREDVRIYFTNAGQSTLTWSDGTTTTFGAGSWSTRNIATIDGALGVMAEATGNNALLRKSDGSEMRMYRHGTTSNNFVAYNSGGDTYYSSQNFSQGEAWTYQVIFHEFAHNFDDDREVDAVIGSNSIIPRFRNLSSWNTLVGAVFSSEGLRKLSSGESVISTDGRWVHDADASFSRDYGKTNPYEDWATTFAAHFMNIADMEYADDDPNTGRDTSYLGGGFKRYYVKSLVDSLKALGEDGPAYYRLSGGGGFFGLVGNQPMSADMSSVLGKGASPEFVSVGQAPTVSLGLFELELEESEDVDVVLV